MACWASCLGTCEGRSSREHLFSSNLFGSSVTVTGGPYGDEPLKIGTGSLVSRILCEKHNSDLSPLDSEAGRFSQHLDELFARHEERSRQYQTGDRSPWEVIEYTANRDLLTRWFTKTTINLAIVLPFVRGWPTGRAAIDPPEALVRTVFLGEPLPNNSKLFAGVKLGALSRPSNEFEFRAHVDSNQQLEAGFFGFRSLSFVMWLSKFPAPAITSGSANSGWDRWNLIGLGGFNFEVGGQISQRLRYFGDFPE